MKILAAATRKTLQRSLQQQSHLFTKKSTEADEAEIQNQALETHFHSAINNSVDSAECEIKLREVHSKLVKKCPPPIFP